MYNLPRCLLGSLRQDIADIGKPDQAKADEHAIIMILSLSRWHWSALSKGHPGILFGFWDCNTYRHQPISFLGNNLFFVASIRVNLRFCKVSEMLMMLDRLAREILLWNFSLYIWTINIFFLKRKMCIFHSYSDRHIVLILSRFTQICLVYTF